MTNRPPDLAAMRRLLAAATPGEWRLCKDFGVESYEIEAYTSPAAKASLVVVGSDGSGDTGVGILADAELIVYAHNGGLAALCDRVEADAACIAEAELQRDAAREQMGEAFDEVRRRQNRIEELERAVDKAAFAGAFPFRKGEITKKEAIETIGKMVAIFAAVLDPPLA